MPTSLQSAPPASISPVPLPARSLVFFGAGVWLLFLSVMSPALYSVDGNSMLAMAEALVTRHNLIVPAALGRLGRGGHYYSTFYPLISWLAVPWVACARLLAIWLRLPPHYVAAMFSMSLSAALVAATATATAVMVQRLGGRRRQCYAAGLAFAFGTVAVVYARNFFAEPLLALITIGVALAALAACDADPAQRRRGAVTCLGLLFLSVWAKPTGLILAPLAALYFFAAGRRWLALGAGFAAAAGWALNAIYLVHYIGTRTTFPLRACWACLAPGIAGLTFSPGFGLLWFCPVCVLAIRPLVRLARNRRPEAVLLGGPLALYLLAYVVLVYPNGFYGAWSWGPRYLVPALPGLAALAAWDMRGRGRVFLCLACLGFLLSAPTLIAQPEGAFTLDLGYLQSPPSPVSQPVAAWTVSRGYQQVAWRPSLSPLVKIWSADAEVLRLARHADPRSIIAAAGSGDSPGGEFGRSLQVVNIWWWLLPAMGISRALGIAVMLVLWALGGGLCFRAWNAPDPFHGPAA